MREKDNRMKQAIKWVWITFGILSGFSVFFFLLIINGWMGYMPSVKDLENPINKYATQVISADMQIMGTYAQKEENRIYVDYKKLSPVIIQALIATEDARFIKHSGIDFYALLRSIIKRGILFQKNGGGGSTISQQLAKQLYSEHAKFFLKRLLQKPIEWIIAVQLERFYTKEEIINMYLNKFDFLYNAVGIQMACHVYFGKSVQDVSIEEAATLIGMCKNPSYFNPLRHMEKTKGRRNVVLDLMHTRGYLSREKCDSLKALPLVVNFHGISHKDGIAPYFREYLRLIMTAKKPNKRDYNLNNVHKYAEDSLEWETNSLYGWCNKNRKSDGLFYNLYTDGLKIYTTLDSRMQTYAEQAVNEHVGGFLQPAFLKEKRNSSTAPYSCLLNRSLVDTILKRAMMQTERYWMLRKENISEEKIKAIFSTPIKMQVFSWQGVKDTVMSPMDSIRYMKSFLRTGFMAMDTHSGAVKAYVGGIDYRYFQYDMVSIGKRQVGSTIKPYLYSLAMESGFTPYDKMDHEPQELITETGEIWSPRNTNNLMRGEKVTLLWGLQHSDNWVSAYLMKQLSPYSFKRMLLSYGLSEPIDAVMSLCLGPCEASVKQMVSGYSAFVNGGVRVEPMFVTRIEDRNGNVVSTFAVKTHEIISEQASYRMLNMLKSVVDGGTGGRMRRYSAAPMGGKTGTTQNNSDCWFIGFTPSIIGGCWVGGEERSIHFNTIGEGQGARSALPIVGIFLKKVFADKTLGYSQSEPFFIPQQFSDLRVSQKQINDSLKQLNNEKELN